MQQSFIARVRDEIVRCAPIYKGVFLDYDYLLCSQAFVHAPYYVIRGHAFNYLHLTGVRSNVPAEAFFRKCYYGTLAETDFALAKSNSISDAVKGSVRRKITVLPDMADIFSPETMIVEGFHRNTITCSFVTETATFTMGFTRTDEVMPMTLLKGSVIDPAVALPLDIAIRCKRGEKRFYEIIVGNEDILQKYIPTIQNLLDPERISYI